MNVPRPEEIRARLARTTPRPLPAGTPGALSSVLVPLLLDGDDLCVVFVRRRADLPVHPGEYSFPGGGREPFDRDAAACALRETHEEIGHPPDRVELWGALDETWTISNYRIEPFVGLLSPPFDFTAQRSELDAVVVLPLAAFLDPARWERLPLRIPLPLPPELAALQDIDFDVPQIVVEGHRIWGATGRILKDFLRVGCGMTW